MMSAKHLGVFAALALAILSGCSSKTASFSIAVEPGTVPACCSGSFGTVISETSGVPGELLQIEAYIRDNDGMERDRMKADAFSIRAGSEEISRAGSTAILGYGRLVLRPQARWDSSWRDAETTQLLITVIATIRDESGETVILQADESVAIRQAS